MDIDALWNSRSEIQWKTVLKTYDDWIVSQRVAALDREIDPVNLPMVKQLDGMGWYSFLYNKYFPWKFTDGRRLKRCRQYLEKHKSEKGLENLLEIRNALLIFPKEDISMGLDIASGIGGLGVAGASGLLALMYPEHYGTVDVFLVLALSKVQRLPDAGRIHMIAAKNENKLQQGKTCSLTPAEGVLLIEIMRRKSTENNECFQTDFWTPRKIDKVLWACGHL